MVSTRHPSPALATLVTALVLLIGGCTSPRELRTDRAGSATALHPVPPPWLRAPAHGSASLPPGPSLASRPPLAALAAIEAAARERRRTLVETGIASWYGPGFAGRPTASGEIFDPLAMTAAHPALPLGAEVVVVNLENGREARLRINDRGPFVGERVIDVSKAAAQKLGFYYTGLAEVRVELVEPVRRAARDDA
jgi:rare lipoprotein A